MSIHDNKTAGTITLVFGTIATLFASMGLAAILIQRMVMYVASPAPQEPAGLPVDDIFDAFHGVFFVFLPLMLVGGIIFCVSGFHLRRGSLAARRIAQANAVAGLVWAVAYSFSLYRAMDILGPSSGVLPEPLFSAARWLSVVCAALMNAAFLSGLLYILSLPQEPSADMPSEPAEPT